MDRNAGAARHGRRRRTGRPGRVSAERLLFRLFHETGVRVFEPMPLEERCTCSAERIEAMLRDNFSAEEREEMVVDGEIEVVCEFCSADYHFKPHEFDDRPRTKFRLHNAATSASLSIFHLSQGS